MSTAKKLRPIDLLRAESARMGLPLTMATDLDHDERYLNRPDAPESFGWVLYEHGTYIVDPHAERAHIAAYVSAAYDHLRGGGAVACYIFERGELKSVPLCDFDWRVAELLDVGEDALSAISSVRWKREATRLKEIGERLSQIRGES